MMSSDGDMKTGLDGLLLLHRNDPRRNGYSARLCFTSLE